MGEEVSEVAVAVKALVVTLLVYNVHVWVHVLAVEDYRLQIGPERPGRP
jgi:hypothetical protein